MSSFSPPQFVRDEVKASAKSFSACVYRNWCREGMGTFTTSRFRGESSLLMHSSFVMRNMCDAVWAFNSLRLDDPDA